jgi:DUF4097 and DUF4098 domain-containing protein YvlB
MRTYPFLLLISVLSISCVSVLADHTLQTQTKSFPADGVEAAILETGAGTLTVTGTSGLSAIEVRAEYKSGSGFSDSAQRILDKLRLSMEVQGNTFYLKSEHLDNWSWGDSGWIDITINMPKEIDLKVSDGSGSMAISGMGRNVTINDGSGEIELTNINGNIRIDDGSGEIRVRNARGDIDIHDGSGSIDLLYIGGNARIRDGSGSIHVADVSGDLIIPNDGSGDIHVENAMRDVDINDGSGSIDVRHAGGSVRICDGSGSIHIDDVGGDLTIPRDGSGSVQYSGIRGKVSVPNHNR